MMKTLLFTSIVALLCVILGSPPGTAQAAETPRMGIAGYSSLPDILVNQDDEDDEPSCGDSDNDGECDPQVTD